MSGTNWSNPVLTSTYAALVTETSARDVSAMTQMRTSLTADTNIPTKAIRWNDTTYKWESWSGTAWSDLAAIYAISISGNAATASNATQLGGVAAANYAPLASPTFTGTPSLPTGSTGITQGATDNSTRLATTGFVQALRDITGGLVGMSLFKINFKNTANTYISFFTNVNTAARTYLFPDKTGTVAMTSDISDHSALGAAAHVATAISTTASGNLTATNVGAALNELQSDVDSRVLSSSKDSTGGVAGLTLFKINFRNALNTFTSFFTNANTAARTYTFPDVDGTVAMTADIAVATVAKTNVAQSFTAAQRGTVNSLTYGVTVTPDFAVGNFFTLTLTGSATLDLPSNLVEGQSGSIFIIQDATGSRTLAYNAAWDFAGGTVPVLSTAVNSVDRLDYLVRSTGSIHAALSKAVA